MYFLKNNDKFRKGLSYSIILTGILFSSSSLCAQNFEGTIVGSGNGSVISISESNKFIMDDREHTHTGRYEIVAGGLSESNDNITTNSITVDNKQTVLNLYGGRSNTGSVSKNNVLLKGESTILIGAYAGYTSQGSVFDNTLTLQGKVIVSNSKIRAGYSDSGKVLRNKLILDNISPLTVTYGGFSGSNLTQGNSIEVKNGTYLEERAYGGYSASGKVDSNSIVINDTSRARFLYGGYSANGSAQGNSVVFKAKEQTNGLPISRARSNVNLISDNGLALTTPPDVDRGTPVDPSLNDKGENKYIAPERVNDYIRNAEIAIGGASDSGLVTQNSIDFQSGIVDTLMGGSSTSGKVIKNSIFLKGGITLGTVYGGFSVKGSTNENMIEISDGFTSKGLLIGGETSKGSTVGNKVIVNGGTVLSDVVGGKNFSSDPNSQNAVFINGGKVIDVYGAFNPSNGDINSNQVVISGGEVSGKVYGGFNGVTFEEHPVDKGVYNNVVKIVGGSVDGEIYGGYSLSDASANNNTVEIHNGNFTQTIYGGYSKDGEALGNNVILAGGKISGDVYASAGKTTVSGVITLREGVDVSSANLHSGVILTDLPFYGMLTLSHAAAPMPLNVKADSNGNNSVLEIDGFSGSVNTLSGFDTIDFKNAVWQKNGSPVLNITDAESSGFKNETKVRVQRITIPNDVDVKEGSLLSLFSDNINGKTNALLQNSSVDIFKGTTLAGMASLNSKNASVDAKIEKLGLNPQTLLVAENRAVASAFANQGSDLIADKLDSLRHLKDGNLSVFTNAYGNASEYNTQSEFKINGYTSSFGVGYASAFDNFDLSLLAFYENSTGRYRTYNSFDGEIFMGFGEINANGGGLASRFDFNNGLYTEASFRAGRLNASMQNALRDINGKFYNYDLNSAYYGMHIGIGRVFDFNPIFDLDVYSKFFYTHTSKDSFNVDDEIFQLDSVTSERVRVGLKSNAAINENLKAYAGLAYEYEFNGSANMKVAGYAFNEQSLKGSSYAAEFGVNYQVIKSLNLDFKGRTYLGKRKGVDGTLGLNYQF